MATLVLGAVGTALGGPVGGALGSLIGQAIDQQLLGSGPRRGPRLGDLSVQTSAYGTMIPRLYGRMRVAGTVVWATDLKETEQAISGGKGGSDTLRYSYTGSFAVALSSRAGGRIGRIWADGKLLRGMAGDLKVKGTLRFRSGDEAQAVDPLIASVEGIGTTPAFRGLAVAVLEDLALAEFGNRIPMLTFEVIADEAAVGVGAILADVTAGGAQSGSAVTLDGYAAHGSDRRGAVTPLVDMLDLPLRERDGRLDDRGSVVVTASEIALGSSADARGAARIKRKRSPLASLPEGVAFTYYDPVRDYQAGLASAGEPGGGRARTIDFAAAIGAGDARALADGRLASERAGRERVTLHLSPAFLALSPGDVIGGAGLVGDWRVVQVDVAALAVTAQLVRVAGRGDALPADSGKAANAADRVLAPTQMIMLDLPDGEGGSLTLVGASSGEWKPVPVVVRVNGIEQAPVTIVKAAISGGVLGSLASGSSLLIDEVNAVDVQLVDSSGWLTSCSDDALVMGVNLAAVGNELIQFARVDPIAAGRYRLSRLLRGRRGTEWAIAGHGIAEKFVLLDQSAMARIALPGDMIGATVSVLAQGVADGASVAVERVAAGEGARPLSPCQLRVSPSVAGIDIAWVRRSRDLMGWGDGLDPAMSAAGETYRVRITRGGAERQWVTAAPLLSVSATDLAALGSGVAAVAVAQLGERGASHENSVSITI